MAQKDTTIKQRHGLYTIILGYFMVQFALVPIAAILPSVTRDLTLTISQSGWIMAVYLLSLTGLLLISGRLGDQIGDIKIFTIGTIIFLIASILCGFSSSFTQLFICRAFQGAGTALMSGNALSIISKLFPHGELRGQVFGKVTSAAAFGSLIGIVMSTIFLQYLSWRWIFWITVPMAVGILFMVRTIKEEKKRIDLKKIDVSGGILLYLLIVLTVFYVSSIPAFGTCSENVSGIEGITCSLTFAYIMPVLFLFLFFLLIRVEKKAEDPIMILHEFKNRLFVTSLGSNFILHLAMINVTFFVPFLVEDGLGMAPIYAGIILISVELMNAVFPRISGTIYSKNQSSLIRPIGMGIILSGFVIYWFFIGSTSIIPYIVIGGWIGIGMGIYWAVNNNIIMNSIKGDYQGFASGMLETSRQMGHTFASSISAVAFTFGAISINGHGHGVLNTGGSLMEASMIFAGTKNIIVISILLTIIGFYLSLFKEKTKANVVPDDKKVNVQ